MSAISGTGQHHPEYKEQLNRITSKIHDRFGDNTSRWTDQQDIVNVLKISTAIPMDAIICPAGYIKVKQVSRHRSSDEMTITSIYSDLLHVVPAELILVPNSTEIVFLLRTTANKAEPHRSTAHPGYASDASLVTQELIEYMQDAEGVDIVFIHRDSPINTPINRSIIRPNCMFTDTLSYVVDKLHRLTVAATNRQVA